MGNINSINSIKKINFENMQTAINDNANYIIINTLDVANQNCLIPKTILPQQEIILLNKCLDKTKEVTIIIYGKNNNDEKVFFKYQQLHDLGFTNVFIYIGGMFEWLLLQEVYGSEQFPTTSSELDILKYE